MIIGIDASQAAKNDKTGIEYFSYQLILNLLHSDSKNIYQLYTNKKLPHNLTRFTNCREIYIPFLKFWNKFRLPLALIKEKPDIFLEPGYMLPPFHPKNSIVVIHDLAYKFYPEAYPKNIKFLQERALISAAKRSKAILFLTNTIKNDFDNFFPNFRGIEKVIGLSIDKSKFDKKYQPQKFSNYLLYVGRIEERKNILNLIKAYEILKSKYKIKQQLVLAGKDGYGSKIIHSYINNSTYKNNIKSLGHIPENSLISLYQNCELFVFPSLYEGFGIPILESFASKSAVVCSDTPSLVEVAGRAALYFNPKSPNNMAQIIYQAISDKNLKNDLINKGQKRIADFDWIKTAKKTVEIFNQIKK